MKGTLLTIIGSIIICSCAVPPKSHLKKTEWLLGAWENKTPRGIIYETWKKTNENELVGKSYIIKENDTIVFENIRLVQEQGGLYYIPTVKDQNNDLPVRFAAKTISDTHMMFENPDHDFPQIISYTKVASDSLVAEISGKINGLERKQTFRMKRVLQY